MFTQKSPSFQFDVYSFLLIPLLFTVGGLLLARHISLAWVFMLVMLPLLAARLVLSVKRAACPTQRENLLLDDGHNIEWTQVIGSDGEVVEVGQVKKRAQPDGC